MAGRLLALLDTTDLPPLFAGLEPTPAPPVDLPPDGEVARLAESAIASTARVASTGCGAGVSVGSGFFVSAEHVVTNAHVVAGGTEHDRDARRRPGLRATVVAFDPAADLALLHVPGAGAPALELSRRARAARVDRRGARLPGRRRPDAAAPASVTAAYEIGGPDIYGDGVTERSVVEMRTRIRPGNSGGPLVVEPGHRGRRGLRRLAHGAGRRLRHRPRPGAREHRPVHRLDGPVDTGACL